MEIIVDEEGKKAIIQLCHIALKAGGIQNLNDVNTIMNSVEEKKPIQEKKDG